jgi:hypothetical protein
MAVTKLNAATQLTGITPFANGGSGIAISEVTKIFWVDGNRTDTYTEDGSLARPYKTIKSCQDAINVLTAGLVSSDTDYDKAKYVVNIAAGTYSDNITINTTGQAKYLRYNMMGVIISGNISIKQEQLGLTDYYSKVEFFGGIGNRPEKGRIAKISGDVTFLKTAYDSLQYDAFFGIEFTGEILYGATAGTGYGTWVLYLEKCILNSISKSITTNFAAGSHCVLIEANDCEIKYRLLGVIDLYDINNCSLRNIDITPANGCTIKNTTFTGTVIMVASKNLSMDLMSMVSMYSQTVTLTGMTLIPLDGTAQITIPVSAAQIIGMSVTPVTLVPAVTGKVIIVDYVMVKAVTTATQFANGTDCEFRYTDGSGAKVTADLAAAVIRAGAGTSYTIQKAVNSSLTGVVSSPIILTNSTTPFDTGTGVLTVTVKYSLV